MRREPMETKHADIADQAHTHTWLLRLNRSWMEDVYFEVFRIELSINSHSFGY